MRIVLVRLSALGDIVHTWPLAEALRSAESDTHLTWVVEKPLAALVEGHPAVDAVMTVATGRWRRRPLAMTTRAEIAALKTRFGELQPDLAIDAQGTLKSALVTRWTGAGHRVGFARPWRRELIAGWGLHQTIAGSRIRPHVAASNLELVRAVGAEPPDPPPPPSGRWLLERTADLTVAGPWSAGFAVVIPGAGHPNKVLSAATLAEIARHLVERGLDAVVVWGPGERTRAEEVVELGGSGVFLAPSTNILELVRLLGSAALAVGGDTGPVHLAASLGTPTVGVHLTTDAARNGPLGSRVATISGAAPGRGPGGSATTGRDRDITGAEVCAAADRLLGSQDRLLGSQE